MPAKARPQKRGPYKSKYDLGSLDVGGSKTFEVGFDTPEYLQQKLCISVLAFVRRHDPSMVFTTKKTEDSVTVFRLA